MAQEILITTTENIPGRHYEIIGEVFGLTTQSKNVISNIGAGLKNLVGVKSKPTAICCMNRAKRQLIACVLKLAKQVAMRW